MEIKLTETTGKRIVTACADGTLMMWDPRSPTPVFKLTAQDGRFDLGGITSLAINPSSTLAVVGGTSGGVRVVSLSKGDVVGGLEGHKEGDSVEAVQFVDLAGAGVGSGVVVTGGTDGKACIWDLTTMRLRTTLEHEVRKRLIRILTFVHDLIKCAGCCNLSYGSPTTKKPSPHVRINGQNLANMGCTYGGASSRAQGASRSDIRGRSGDGWWDCCERRR